jgi:arginyl-tRNA synthetase
VTQGLVQEQVANAVQGALSEAKAKGQLKIESWPILTLDAPKRPEWGDLATTVAMSLAASEKRAPHDIAQIIADNLLTRDQLFERVVMVRPGFLNLTVKPATGWKSYGTSSGAAYGTSVVRSGNACWSNMSVPIPPGRSWAC